MNSKSGIYTCREHIDIGIDDFVNTNQQAPELEKIRAKQCDYCSREAIYHIYKKTDN